MKEVEVSAIYSSVIGISWAISPDACCVYMKTGYRGWEVLFEGISKMSVAYINGVMDFYPGRMDRGIFKIKVVED